MSSEPAAAPAEGTPQHRVLVVDDDPSVRLAVGRMLERGEFDVTLAEDGREALRSFDEHDFDVALIDLDMPGMHGLELLAILKRDRPSLECVVFTGHGDVTTGLTVLQAGASDYFEKPVRDKARLIQVLRRAAEVRRLKTETERLAKRVAQTASPLIGNSAPMVELRAIIDRVAKSQASILILGESGSGKELVAEAIHVGSGRRGEFVRINCASMPRELLESELFGWEKGAHNQATQPKEGLFETAADGTVLLDEIGDMPIDLQVKLLRVLESRRFRRLGGLKEKDLRARVLAATNVDLPRAIAEGRFREDLFYRLDQVSVRVPPLRERKGDVPILTYHFVNKFNEIEGRAIRHVTEQAMVRLEAHDWPGNVRELRNVLYKAFVLAEGPELDLGASPGQTAVLAPATRTPTVIPASNGTPADPFAAYLDLEYPEAKQRVIDDFSRRYVQDKLDRYRRNITRAAAASGLLRPNFGRLMRQLGIKGSGVDEA